MARIPAAVGDGEVADRIRLRRPGRVLRPIDVVLLHSPEIADGWNSLLRSIRSAASLPAAVRELVILRIAVLNDAPYEWDSHLADARAAGLRTAQIDAVRDPWLAASAELSDIARIALRLTDVMTRDISVPDDLFDELRLLFDLPQLVELVVTVAAYNMVSRFVVALAVETRDAR